MDRARAGIVSAPRIRGTPWTALARASSADPRQRLAERKVEDALSADWGLEAHESRVLGHNPADARGLTTEGMLPRRSEHPLRALGVTVEDDPAADLLDTEGR